MPSLKELGVTGILELLAQGRSQNSIAKELGVSRQAVNGFLKKNGLLEKARNVSKEARSTKKGIYPRCPSCGGLSQPFGYIKSDNRRRYLCSECSATFSEAPKPKPDKPAPNAQAQRMREYRKRKKRPITLLEHHFGYESGY